ncbi:MAG: DUF2953 domain-containing protein [Rubrivivax sp.]|nr:DUF2953 domain-containing protein [Rubrivivax sp.]
MQALLVALAWALAWTLALLLLAAGALVLLPVRLRLLAATEPVRQWRLEVGLFGGLLPRWTAIDSRRPRRPPMSRQDDRAEARSGRRDAAATARSRRPRSDSPPRRRAWLRRQVARRIPVLLREAPALLRDLLGCVRVERLQAAGRFGLDDPADTGQAWGLVAPWLYAIPGARARCDIAPDFERPGLQGRAEAQLRVVPATLLLQTLRHAWRVLRGPRP